MKRKIIRIDEDKCNGCGLCVKACHEGALQIVDGKAKLVSESYCDGLGDCLPECPTGAISIEEREAAAYDQEAVDRHLVALKQKKPGESPAEPVSACACPGTKARLNVSGQKTVLPVAPGENRQSQLAQWPCQLKLVPAGASFLDQAHLLLAADCTAFAYPDVHERFMRGKITLIGCPKLDNTDYAEKLAAILAGHKIKSVTVLRMEVPCCGGLVHFLQKAMTASGQIVPWNVVTITTNGQIAED